MSWVAVFTNWIDIYIFEVCSRRRVLARRFGRAYISARILLRAQPRRIIEIKWAIVDVGVEIDAALKSDRVLAEEAANCRVVISGAVVIEASFGVEFTACVVERINDGARRGGQVAESVVGVGVRYCSRGVAQRRDRAETVGIVVARCTGAKFS